MIKADLATVIFIYLFILAVVPLIVWLVLERGRKATRSTDGNKTLWQCSVCTHVYSADKDQSITTCPSCKSYNRREEEL